MTSNSEKGDHVDSQVRPRTERENVGTKIPNSPKMGSCLGEDGEPQGEKRKEKIAYSKRG